MVVEVHESDNGTKEALKQTMAGIANNLPQAIAAELDAIWEAILWDAILFSQATMYSGALASSIRIVDGPEMMSGATSNGKAGFGPARQPVVRGTSSQTIFDRSITVGDASVSNWDNVPTDVYAFWVHEGHRMRDGTFWEGNPFLTDAMDAHQAELDAAIEKAMKEMGISGRE